MYFSLHDHTVIPHYITVYRISYPNPKARFIYNRIRIGNEGGCTADMCFVDQRIMASFFDFSVTFPFILGLFWSFSAISSRVFYLLLVSLAFCNSFFHSSLAAAVSFW